MTRRRPVVDFYHLFDEDDIFAQKITVIIMERVEFFVQLGGRSEHLLQLGGRSLHDLQIGSRAEFEIQH